ncbi:hypothetical protein [Pseudoalteromonas sp. NBT06-2]|uniref:hypothetical protein n=1 Tax=Pseudoalteromonas sp. NBT06-2 TaxID=2025950 RepID=UPI00336BE472
MIKYIWQTYEIRFSISGLNKWLHQHNVSYTIYGISCGWIKKGHDKEIETTCSRSCWCDCSE